MYVWVSIVAAALVWVAGGALWAQNATATVSGLVMDTLDAVIADAAIRVRHLETNQTREIRSRENGEFTLTNLAPGGYELTVEHSGFRKHHKTGIVLELGQVLREDIRLQVGAVTESVDVTAEVAVVNTETGAIKGDVMTTS